MMNKLLIPQRFKKYPLNLWVKLRFFNFTVKPISYPSYPHLPHGFRKKPHLDWAKEWKLFHARSLHTVYQKLLLLNN